MSQKKAKQKRALEARKSVFTLSSYDPVELKLRRVEVSNEQVEQQLMTIAEQYADFQAISGRDTVHSGDHVRVSIESMQGGEPYPMLTGTRILQPGEGYMPEEFESQIASMHIGERKTFDFQAPTLEEGSEEPGSETITSTVTLLEICEYAVPEITDEWVVRRIPGANSVAEFREVVRSELQTQVSQQLEQEKYHMAAVALARRLNESIPDNLFKKALADTRQGFETNLRRQGKDRAAFLQEQNISEQQLSMEMLMQTREMLAQALALDAMAQYAKLTVDDSEVNAVFGCKTPEETAAARKEAVRAGKLNEVRQLALRNKALRWVLENAKIEYEA